jgi:hypothetical protein
MKYPTGEISQVVMTNEQVKQNVVVTVITGKDE